VLLISSGAFGVTYINHFLGQYAGEIGFFSLGVGRDFNRYSISGMYGFVPEDLSGADSLETVAMRQTYRFWDWERLEFYGGLNVFHVLGLQYQSTKFRDAPEGYYSIGSIRALLNLGVGARVRGNWNFYFEAGMNDIWITNFVSNADVVNPTDHVSLGLGIKKSF
jgi:hypothetical protein